MSLAITPVELSRRLTRGNIAYTVARMKVIEAPASRSRCGASPKRRRDFRGRGPQTALLRHRTAIAAQSGARLIDSQAAFGSVSHRNMERVGLRVLAPAPSGRVDGKYTLRIRIVA